MIKTVELKQQVEVLLNKAGLSPIISSIQPCLNGGNNRTYRLETGDGVFAVKQYFRQSGDARDRLASEFAFLSYAKMAAPMMVPICYSKDSDAGLALYEFIEGEPLKETDITESDVTQAISFFQALNNAEIKSQAQELPLASEACFSIQDHLSLVGSRIQSLQQISTETEEDKEAARLVEDLNTCWQTIFREVKAIASSSGDDITAPLHHSSRCISPSDFGFHNALKLANGTICFLDFEYAGWDDPAKMTGDFFSQLAVPVHADYFDKFVNQVMLPFTRREDLVRRAKLLRSVYQIKWCCIALNIFIPVNLARRRFANPELNVKEMKKMQLVKAASLLKKIGR